MKTKVKNQIIGKVFDKDISRDDIVKLTGYSVVRINKPDSVGTCDMRPDRLNVQLDSDNEILSLDIG